MSQFDSITDERWEQLHEIRSMLSDLYYRHSSSIFSGYCDSIDWYNEEGYDSINWDLNRDDNEDVCFEMYVISHRGKPITEWTINIDYHADGLPTLTFNATKDNLIELMLEKIPQAL